MQDEYFFVEIVYGEPQTQTIIKQKIKKGTTLQQAIVKSKILQKNNIENVAKLKFGIFGNIISKPNEYILTKEDRIEIYRPLTADLKEIRLKRLSKLKEKK